MGEAAFKTPRMLWSIKTRRAQEDAAGPAARRGRELERRARRAYEQQVGIQMEPLCLVHDQLEWMRASLDGLSFDGSTVLEIKCPMNVHDQTVARQGSVPPQYYAQLQHALEVSRAEEVHYWSFDASAGSLVRIRSDRIPEAASGCRGRILAAGQGECLARARGRRTRLERRS
jgi:putative phage-type endonuclease